MVGAVPPDPDRLRSARDRVLYRLKTKGPQTAAELARPLGVTTMAVRQHLQALAVEGLVQFRDERRKVGRPARIWSLAPPAAGRFPDSHGDLSADLIRAARATFGAEGLDRLIAERTRQQRESYRERMPAPAVPVEDRLAALATIRAQEGYMAEWSQEADGSWLFCENHCPICAAASACQGFCRDELALFAEILGGDVAVTREEHILAGARRCAYRVRRAGTSKDAAAAEAASGHASGTRSE